MQSEKATFIYLIVGAIPAPGASAGAVIQSGIKLVTTYHDPSGRLNFAFLILFHFITTSYNV